MYTYSEENRERIRLIAEQIRLKHGAMDWGVPIEDLIKKQGLDYSEYDLNSESFLSKIRKAAKKVAEKIKAAIFVSEKLILVDRELHYKKKPWGQAHELGHHAIPEHREILYVCSEHDLSKDTRDQMEFEANVFAAELLCPAHLIDEIHINFPIDLQTILYLASVSKGSIESCAIRYVKTSKRTCALLTFENKDGSFIAKNKPLYSSKWWKKYKNNLGDLNVIVNGLHLYELLLKSSTVDIAKDSIDIGGHNLEIQTFCNSFTYLALIFEQDFER